MTQVRRLAMLTTAACLARAAAAWAGSGRDNQLAAACASCHEPKPGEAGISSLTGRTEASIAQTLRAYRSGQRVGQIMQVVSGSLSLDEIDEVARAVAAGPAQTDR